MKPSTAFNHAAAHPTTINQTFQLTPLMRNLIIIIIIITNRSGFLYDAQFKESANAYAIFFSAQSKIVQRNVANKKRRCHIRIALGAHAKWSSKYIHITFTLGKNESSHVAIDSKFM